MQQPRRALVISGGGAKGAYSFGCLLAFRQAGVEFVEVAGTSVGALNALLWAAGALEEGRRLWHNLSLHRIYPVSLVDPDRHHRFVVLAAAMAYVTMRILWATFQRLPVPQAGRWRATLALLAASPILLSTLPFAEGPWDVATLTAATAFMAAVNMCLIHSGKKHGQVLLAATFGLATALPCAAGLATLLEHTITSGTVRILVALPLVVALSLVQVLLLWRVYGVLGRLSRNDLAVLANSPLIATIRGILDHHELRVPTIVTVAREAEVFDPDRPDWFTLSADARGLPRSGATWEPATTRVWVPSYISLNNASPDDAALYAAASAALPFGIVPPVMLNSVAYIDGGVVDNCPTFPFMNRPDIDEVFVLLLDPYRSDDEAIRSQGLLPEDWTNHMRQLALADFPIPGSASFENRPFTTKNDPPRVVPREHPTHWPRIVPFYPARSLGGFIRGTLKFDAAYVQDLMEEGFAATVHKLESDEHSVLFGGLGISGRPLDSGPETTDMTKGRPHER